MKDILTSRFQVFLAKIAGRNVSESTLTPPVVTNMEEKLLDEIAERIDTIEGRTPAPTGGVPLFVNVSTETTAMDKTWKEVHDAFLNEGVLLRMDLVEGSAIMSVSGVMGAEGTYFVLVSTIDGMGMYATDSESGYPSLLE